MQMTHRDPKFSSSITSYKLKLKTSALLFYNVQVYIGYKNKLIRPTQHFKDNTVLKLEVTFYRCLDILVKQEPNLKGVFAKNERGYKLNAIKRRF